MKGRFIFKNLLSGIFLNCLILGGFIVQAAAGTSTKPFDFGAGGDNPSFRSHSRSFTPPENVAVVVALNYRTAGEAAIPVVIEIEDSANQILASREVNAEKTGRRVVVNISAAENKIHGCEKAWQVRVRSKSGEIPAARVFGDITFSFVDPAAVVVELEEQPNKLGKGENLSKNVGDADTFNHPGIISVRASWLHSLVNLVLPLKFELIRPDGSTAKTLIAYGANSNGNPRLDFSHKITVAETKQKGVWKLRISNETEHEIIEIKPIVTFTKKCLE